jgi:hypothetical protein
MYEPGYDDVAAASGCIDQEPVDALLNYSLRWVAAGFQWQGRSAEKPSGWSGEQQFQRLLLVWNKEAEAEKLPPRMQ